MPISIRQFFSTQYFHPSWPSHGSIIPRSQPPWNYPRNELDQSKVRAPGARSGTHSKSHAERRTFPVCTIQKRADTGLPHTMTKKILALGSGLSIGLHLISRLASNGKCARFVDLKSYEYDSESSEPSKGVLKDLYVKSALLLIQTFWALCKTK